jgi:hypothetical protein
MPTVRRNNINVRRELVQVMLECVNLDVKYCGPGGRPLSCVSPDEATGKKRQSQNKLRRQIGP